MERFLFPKSVRLLKRNDFIRLSKIGKKSNSRRLLAVFAPGKTGCTRLGITVTKKIGNAVNRNRIKRITREYFRLNKCNIEGNWDINIIAGKGLSELTCKEIFISLNNIFKNISG